MDYFRSVTAALVTCTCLLSSCLETATVPQKYQGVATTTFDYATSVTYTASVSFPNWKPTAESTGIYFEVYAESPLDGAVLKSGLKPVFCSYTKSDGTWKGTIEIPAYVKSLYIYAPDATENQVQEVSISGTQFSVACTASDIASSASGTMINREMLSDVYLFEDTYPDPGDNDLNDLVVQVDKFRHIGIYESGNERVACLNYEKFRFTTFENVSSGDNGLAVEFVLGNNIILSNIKNILFTIDGRYMFTEEDMYPTSTGYYFYITPDIHRRTENCRYILAKKMNDDKAWTWSGHTVELTVYYYNPNDGVNTTVDLNDIAAGQSKVRPFVYRWEEDCENEFAWEVHVPYETPSPLATDYRRNFFSEDIYTYFQTLDDGSEPENGMFYTRSTSEGRYRPYPFAVKLSGVEVLNSNLYNLLLPSNDKSPIDSLFTTFTDWVEDQATDRAGTYDNWYLK